VGLLLVTTSSGVGRRRLPRFEEASSGMTR
jgi:hypothetical protein